jgi:hypothetical protein
VARLCAAATAARLRLITSIAESAPNPISATLPAMTPAPIATTALDHVPAHGEVLKPPGTMVQNDAAFRRDSDHDHLGHGDWSRYVGRITTRPNCKRPVDAQISSSELRVGAHVTRYLPQMQDSPKASTSLSLERQWADGRGLL